MNKKEKFNGVLCSKSMTLHRIVFSLVFAFSLIGLIASAFAGPNTEIPFTDDFESYDPDTPLVNGTNGWYGSSVEIIVQTNVVYSGEKAVMIPLDSTLSNRFTGINNTNIWMQMNVRPMFYDGEEYPSVDTNASAIMYLSSNGNFVVHNGPYVAAETNWVVVSGFQMDTNANDWVMVGILHDYVKQSWDVYADGVVLTNNIGFINTNITFFSGFDVYNGMHTSYVDNVYISSNVPKSMAVIGKDGSLISDNILPDAAKGTDFGAFVYGASPVTNTFAITNSGDWFLVISGISTNGADPEAFVIEGVTDVVSKSAVSNFTVSFNPALGAGSYEASVTISNDSVNVPLYVMNLKAVVDKKSLTVDIVPSISKLYNGNETATLGITNFNFTGLVYGETTTVSQTTGTYASKNVGANITVSAALDSSHFSEAGGFLTNNYDLPAVASGNVGEITQQPLTAVLVPVIQKIYDGTTTATVGATNYSLVGLVGAETPVISQTAGVYDDEKVGTNKLVTVTLVDADFADDPVSGFLKANYILPVTATGSVGEILPMIPSDKLVFVVSPGDTESGANLAPVPVVEVRDQNNNLITDSTAPVSMQLTLGSGELLGITNINAIAGVARFASLRIEELGDKQLTAVSKGMSNAVSAVFNILLPAPDLVTASKGRRDIIYVEWNAVADATGYQVWRGIEEDAAAAVKIAELTSTEYTDGAAMPGVRYYYRIKGVKNASIGAFSVSAMGWRGGVPGDFDGDGRSDPWYYYEPAGHWYLMLSATLPTNNQFGALDMMPVPGDFDGDGRADIAVYDQASGFWYVLFSDSGDLGVFNFGGPGYAPVHADYDGDGLMDVAVYNEESGMWYVFLSSSQDVVTLKLGGSGFTPVPADYNGDGKADYAVYEESTGYWYILMSSSAIMHVQKLGEPGFVPVPGDYTGDGRADIMVYETNAGIWHLLTWNYEYKTFQFGWSEAVPVPADYDGDGIMDLAVFYKSQYDALWYFFKSSEGFSELSARTFRPVIQ